MKEVENFKTSATREDVLINQATAPRMTQLLIKIRNLSRRAIYTSTKIRPVVPIIQS